MAVEGYTAPELFSVGNDLPPLSGGDRPPADGEQERMYSIYWRYDPVEVSGGITGISWFSELYGPLSSLGIDNGDINEELSQYTGDLKTYIDSFFSSWNTRGDFMSAITNMGGPADSGSYTMSGYLDSVGCLEWHN